MKVLQFPLAKIIIVFILGILTSFYLKPEVNFIFELLFISFISLIISCFIKKQRPKNNTHFIIFAYLSSFLIGASTLIIHTESYQKTHYIHSKAAFEKEQLITVLIREKIKSTSYNERYIALVKTIEQKNYTGKIILNIPKDRTNNFETGSLLRIKGTLQKNKTASNPNQFDYASYLSNKQIYAQLYTDKSQISISTNIEKDIWHYISKLRTRIIYNLEKSHFNQTELNVAKALIMGQRQDISPEIIQDYQYAGAIHILSVSGLHVGILLLFINFLLKPIPNSKRGSFIKLATTILCLTLFALIAGLTPSIVRSVVMFSFVAVGLNMRKSVNIYHTLLISIFLILLFQPTFLFDVGFQLSYTAVLFIVWFQPLLNSLWEPKNKILKYFWGILTVSFAAQIGTLPLSMYYFHQFPGLFFVTNLAVIPLLSLIMVVGILVMIFAALGFTSVFLSKPLEFSIYCINKIINTIASFEQFIIKDIPFNFHLLFCYYLLIISTIIWFSKPNFSKFTLVLVSIISLQSTFLINKWNIQQQQEWVVLNSKKNTIIMERHGKNTEVIANDSILKTLPNNKMVSSYLVSNFSNVTSKKSLKHFMFFKGNKILILDNASKYPTNYKPDILLLTQSTKVNLDRALQILKPKLVIADASNYKTIQKHWKRSCEKQKIPFHATAEKGFYRIN